MKNNDWNKAIADSGFGFSPGFSERVIRGLKQSGPLKDASSLLTERIGRMFYWINIPVAAALFILMLLFFLNSHREKGPEYASGAGLNEYVFDYYVSSQSELFDYD